MASFFFKAGEEGLKLDQGSSAGKVSIIFPEQKLYTQAKAAISPRREKDRYYKEWLGGFVKSWQY